MCLKGFPSPSVATVMKAASVDRTHSQQESTQLTSWHGVAKKSPCSLVSVPRFHHDKCFHRDHRGCASIWGLIVNFKVKGRFRWRQLKDRSEGSFFQPTCLLGFSSAQSSFCSGRLTLSALGFSLQTCCCLAYCQPLGTLCA